MESQVNFWGDLPLFSTNHLIQAEIEAQNEFFNEMMLGEALKTFVNYAPLKQKKRRTRIEEYFDLRFLNSEFYELLSVILQSAIEENYERLVFPVVWGYTTEPYTDSTTGKFIASEEVKFRATSLKALEAQLDGLLNPDSNFEDPLIDRTLFFFMVNQQKKYAVKKKTKRVKKQKGRGNLYQKCNVIDNEWIYCGPTGKCLLDCLSLGKPIKPHIQDKIERYLKEQKVFRYNIATHQVRKIAEIMGVKFNFYRPGASSLRFKKENGQIILCLLNSHWIVLKNEKKLRKCYKYAQDNIVWTDKPVSECTFETQQNTPKFHSCPNEVAYSDIYIQDFEAYPDSATGQFVPYASGFVDLSAVKKFLDGKSKIAKSPDKYVEQTEGLDCAIEMLRKINRTTKKLSKPFIGKDGKPVLKEDGTPKMSWQKRNIYIYAHNGAQFDSYFYLDVPGIKCSNMVEKGGIMSMTIVAEEFINCNFIIRDTRKFLAKSLKALCQSFQIDEKYSKSEMDHSLVNAQSWKSLQHIWSPYLTLDVTSLALIWVKFTDKMRLIAPDVDLRQYCSIAQLSYSVACKNQKLMFFVDPKLRQFIQSSIRGGRVIARKQEFRTKYLSYILRLHGVSSIDQLVGKKLSPETLALIGQDYQISFDATSLYPSAMYLPHASYLDTEKCYALTMEQSETFDPQQWRDKKFIIECDLYAPRDLQFVPLSVKTEYGAQFATGNLRNIVVNDVDLFECFRFGYQLKKVHQGIWSEPVQFQFIKDFVKIYYDERAKVKKTDPVLGDTYKLILNSAYGKFGQKRCDTETVFTTEKEMDNEDHYTEDIVEEPMLLGNGQVCYKRKKAEKDGEKQSPHHIQSYILAYSKQIMNNFVLLLGAEKENLISYMDTDSFYIHSKDFAKLAHVKDELGGGKNDYGDSKVIIKADYLGCKSKICYVLDTKTMMLQKNVTWKGISDKKFKEIGQITVNRVKLGDDYITGIEAWDRCKLTGITLTEGTSKKLSIEVYCQKYHLIDGVYHFKYIE